MIKALQACNWWAGNRDDREPRRSAEIAECVAEISQERCDHFSTSSGYSSHLPEAGDGAVRGKAQNRPQRLAPIPEPGRRQSVDVGTPHEALVEIPHDLLRVATGRNEVHEPFGHARRPTYHDRSNSGSTPSHMLTSAARVSLMRSIPFGAREK